MPDQTLAITNLAIVSSTFANNIAPNNSLLVGNGSVFPAVPYVGSVHRLLTITENYYFQGFSNYSAAPVNPKFVIVETYEVQGSPVQQYVTEYPQVDNGFGGWDATGFRNEFTQFNPIVTVPPSQQLTYSLGFYFKHDDGADLTFFRIILGQGANANGYTNPPGFVNVNYNVDTVDPRRAKSFNPIY